jgi:hypothetical protein
MTKLAIASVDALKAAPFTVHPLLALTLQDDLGTPRRYIQMFDPEVEHEELEAHARALEADGAIAADELAADWTLDQDAIDAARAQIAGDEDDAAYDAAGMAEPEVDNVEEIEPVA